jgi:hypothetical protein
MTERRLFRALWLAAALGTALLCAANLVCGEVN